MPAINISHEKKKWLIFGAVFLYLVGPVFRIYHAYVSDIYFSITFCLIYLSGTKLRFDNPVSKIFLIPIGIALISLAGKYFWGYSVGMDETANFLNFIKLYFLFILTYSFFIESADKDSLRNNLKNLNYIVMFFVCFISIIGILQFIHSPIADYIIKNFYHVVHKTGTDNIYEFQLLNRVTSIFDSFNGMGIVLCFTLFILIYLNIELRNYRSIIILLLGITLIFLTGNRASLIILLLMSIAYLLYINKKINLKIIGSILGIFIVSGLIFFLIADYLSFDNYIRFYEFKLFLQNGSIPPTLQVRFDKWQWLPSYMKTVSQGIFGYTTNDFIKDKIYTSPDNQYLNWLVYYGYTGLLLFLIWIIYALKILLSNKKILKAVSLPSLNNFSAFSIIYWTGLIIIGFFQESFFFGRLRELFIFFLAMNTAYVALNKKNISQV